MDWSGLDHGKSRLNFHIGYAGVVAEVCDENGAVGQMCCHPWSFCNNQFQITSWAQKTRGSSAQKPRGLRWWPVAWGSEEREPTFHSNTVFPQKLKQIKPPATNTQKLPVLEYSFVQSTVEENLNACFSSKSCLQLGWVDQVRGLSQSARLRERVTPHVSSQICWQHKWARTMKGECHQQEKKIPVLDN